MTRLLSGFLIGISLLALLTSSASAVLIDDFTAGTLTITRSTENGAGSTTVAQNNLTGVIPDPGTAPPVGEREITLDIIDAGTVPEQVTTLKVVTAAPGVVDLATASDHEAEFLLKYGALAPLDGDTTNLDADIAPTDEDAFTFFLLAGDHDGFVDVDVLVDADGAADGNDIAGGDSLVFTASAPWVQTGYKFQLQYNTLVGPGGIAFNPDTHGTDVDGLKFRFYKDPSLPNRKGLDVTIDLINTEKYIPEPATMSLLGLGALGLVVRRRRKRS